jgi:hypothetical protein
MSAEGKLKTSYEFTPKNKVKLTKLKMALKLKGRTGVSESSILEVLIGWADATKLAALFDKRDKKRERDKKRDQHPPGS